MEAIKERMEKLRELAEGWYDRGLDVVLTEEWSTKLCGRRIITHDAARANESRSGSSRTGTMGIVIKTLPVRIFFCDETSQLQGNGSAAQPSSRFLTIPTEIRLQILEEALRPSHIDTAQNSYSNLSPSAVSIIFTCRQLYEEARALAIRHTVVKEIGASVVRHSTTSWRRYG
ncbi:hypothetical protein EJ08DRAFT_254282 [Tothia fuscella]|uniref:Uncharacterized protein n=1 Tax=Tothia fuscella TaxID=1048955 RepID=A0A9P4TXB5_9PEZI|nr:hypothetical protein EJ08DRAFT_254282 [Tothia fuscella]